MSTATLERPETEAAIASAEGTVTPSEPYVLLIDGHSLARRAYHAISSGPEGGLRSSKGVPISVCYGFLDRLCSILESERPYAIAIAFDTGEPTFRHGIYPEYKAGRKPVPDDFKPDLENLINILKLLAINVFSVAGFEADDVLATLSAKAVGARYRVKILSGDRDLWQLVDDGLEVSVLYLNPKGQRVSEIREADVRERFGIHPYQLPDFKAIAGDSSDNIPGVKGIGEKGAAKLLDTFDGVLEICRSDIEKIPGRYRPQLPDSKSLLSTVLSLTQLNDEVPLVTEAGQRSPIEFENLVADLEIDALVNRLSDAVDVRSNQIVQDLIAEQGIAFTCSRTDLDRAVSLVAPVAIACKSVVHPCLNNLVIEVSNGSVSFSAFDLSCRIDFLIEDAEIQGHGKIFVEAKDFKRVIASLQSEFVTVQVADRVQLVGDTTVIYIGRRSDEYVALPRLDSEAIRVEIDREALVSAIAQTQVCMSRCPTKPGLNTLHLEAGTNGLEIWAIDGHRGAIAIVSADPCPEISINLYRQHVPHLLRVLKAAGCKTVCLDVRGNYATFYCGNATLTAKLQVDSYPKLNTLFPLQARRTAVLDRLLLVACVRRLRAQNFYRCTIQIDNLDGLISIKTSKGEAQACETFFAQLANFSAADEFVADLGYFAAAIESLPCQEISLGFSHGSKLLLIQPLGGSTKHFIHLLVPGGEQ